ncbi:SDR family NAD(P)-dependent oxidoreductase [Rubrivirga sp. IMCC45206]|uniref:SDR family NAD(P)-dependent oxidoreductase n=1 Tax=Rubrivirga sp. IMCC45206 TaxID=3391614 RepID=UPI0039900D37
MTDYYTGRTALVTGASSGIGADMARQLGATGAHVVLVARSENALATVAGEVRAAGGTATVVAADLDPRDAPAALAARLDADGLAVDVLVNNAGFGVQGPFLDASAEQAEGMVGLNVMALTSLTRRLLPGMVGRGRGGVLNVASVAAFVPAPSFAVYAATKSYVLSFSEALWAEMRGTGVHVSCLCPGPVRTGFADRAGMNDAFFNGALPSETVARQGLAGLAANTRRVVPGVGNKVQAIAAKLGPTSLGLAVAGAVMKKAG